MIRVRLILPILAMLVLCTASFGVTDSAQAISIVHSAAACEREKGAAEAIKQIGDPKGPYVRGPLYVFAYDTSGTMLAHPKNPKLVGKNMLDVPDIDGTFFRREIVALARSKGSGWIGYKYKNPITNRVENKVTYVLKSGSLILCCGIYRW